MFQFKNIFLTLLVAMAIVAIFLFQKRDSFEALENTQTTGEAQRDSLITEVLNKRISAGELTAQQAKNQYPHLLREATLESDQRMQEELGQPSLSAQPASYGQECATRSSPVGTFSHGDFGLAF